VTSIAAHGTSKLAFKVVFPLKSLSDSILPALIATGVKAGAEVTSPTAYTPF
jgi:hypothetical protein